MYAGVAGSSGVRGGVASAMEMTFGQWLREHIVATYKTQRAFADAIGKETTYISRWVNDHERPSYESARQIHELLGIPIAEILSRAGMPIRPEDMKDRNPADRPIVLARLMDSPKAGPVLRQMEADLSPEEYEANLEIAIDNFWEELLTNTKLIQLRRP